MGMGPGAKWRRLALDRSMVVSTMATGGKGKNVFEE